MQRRKFLLGMGSLAAGGAAAIGSGAYSVQATRSVSVQTTGDASALLQLDGSNATNGEYASGAGSGKISISLDNLNRDSTTQVNDIFWIKNTGDRPVVAYVDPSSINQNYRTTSSGFGVDPQATNRPYGDYRNDDDSGADSIVNGTADDQISLTGLYHDPPYLYDAYMTNTEEKDSDDSLTNNDGSKADAVEEFLLGAGDALSFGVYVNIPDRDIDVDVTMDLAATTNVVEQYQDSLPVSVRESV